MGKPKVYKSTRRTNGRAATALCLLATQLLTACASAATTPRRLIPTSEEEIVLRPGDRLHVEVWRNPEYSGEFLISADGSLVHPLYQDVRVAGLRLSTARLRLSEFLESYLQGVPIVVEPLSAVTISGEVREPNVYYVERGTSIAEAIGRAGGPTDNALLDQVRLIRDGQEYLLSLSEELTTYGSVRVESGDEIYIDRESEFSVIRDIVSPASTLAVLVLTIIRISDRTNN